MFACVMVAADVEILNRIHIMPTQRLHSNKLNYIMPTINIPILIFMRYACNFFITVINYYCNSRDCWQ